jgi:hypothetical protein
MFEPEQQTSTDRRPRNAGPAPPPYRGLFLWSWSPRQPRAAGGAVLTAFGRTFGASRTNSNFPSKPHRPQTVVVPYYDRGTTCLESEMQSASA